MSARIPATVVTGFLGAGKTTLIRNLIRHADGRRIAVIVNEFGDMGFDGELLGDCGDPTCKPDEIVELTNGCICCTVADEFLPTMEMLLAREPAPEHIIVETSGLALPQPLVRAFTWPSVRHRVTVDSVVTVIDAPAVLAGTFAPEGSEKDQQVREHDDPVEELFEDQLRCADLVVISKADIVDTNALARVGAIAAAGARPATSQIASTGEGLPSTVLLGIGAAAEDHMAGRESHHERAGHEDHDHDDFASFVVGAPAYGSLEVLRSRVADALTLPGVLRIKGYARVVEKAAPVVVQGVGRRLETYFDPSSGHDDGLVVIGLRSVDPERVTARLAG
ncbi:cobalamin biosynthesis protein CobW [Bauldia sp.]|uniref:cobalamin biosynthesis protein CobW n=1 Tax=Bauldia sp. TaxID=2575872 RepID=UPI003BAA564E